MIIMYIFGIKDLIIFPKDRFSKIRSMFFMIKRNFLLSPKSNNVTGEKKIFFLSRIRRSNDSEANPPSLS